jgi:hypothetical protein
MSSFGMRWLSITASLRVFSCTEMGSRTREGLIADLFSLGMQKDWSREELQGLFSRMARLDSGKNRHIDLPDRCREVAWIALRFVSLFPAEKAGFVLPHIEGMGQHGLVLDPNDLLMNENAAVTHGLFDFNLTL